MTSPRVSIESASISTGSTIAYGLMFCIRYVWLTIFLLLCTAQVWADVRLGAGDQLEISVVGVPELQRRTPVEPDGTISFPLLGTLSVAGQSLAEIRTRIKSSLALRVYRQRTSNDIERAIVIGIDDITVVMAGYRPIYVKGGIARAGEYTYRPSMTVREAVALSGGYDILPVKVSNPYLDTVDFRGEYEALWLEFARQQARVWRLNAELKDQVIDEAAATQNIAVNAPISRAMIANIAALATDRLKTRRADYRRQEAFLKQSIGQTLEQIETISHQKAQHEAGAVADAEDLERVIALNKSGSIVNSRVIEARRNVLLSVTRKLQTAAELMQMKQQKTNLARQLDRLADERRIAVLEKLEDATIRLGEIRTKLQSVGEKLQFTATAKAQITDAVQRKPSITVHRKEAKGWQRLVANEAFELQPGDVVEITVGQ